MTNGAPTGRLELTWVNKDKVLLSAGEGRYSYEWVDPADYRAKEVRLADEVGEVAAADGRTGDRREGDNALPTPTTGNLLFAFKNPATSRVLTALVWLNNVNANQPSNAPQWHYLLATETDIEQVKGSWSALKNLTELA